MFFTPPPPEPPKAPIVTVWVHGTKPDLPPFLAKMTKNITLLLSDDTKGLCKIVQSETYHYPSLRAQALTTVDPIHFNAEHFYTFGWSGNLNLLARQKAAYDLFYALKDLTLTYQEQYGYTPEIILISHSHGGNVILHLAEIDDPAGFKLSISKAILLACPVQKHTTHLVSSPVFNRIYSLHSHTDMIQIADMQGLRRKEKIKRPLFSNRHFDAHPKIAQASIRWKKCPLWNEDDLAINKLALQGLIKALNTLNYIKKSRGLFHVEFGLLPFVRQLPAIIEQLDNLFDTGSNCSSHKNEDIIIEL
ncbi:MAG TPA: hypothetical protein VHX42_01365 [Candidatus Babeliales bacterium]|jgi:hypothetical protein|nr:hypothetical protein [Candidatus Babeliales bacterium]